MVKKYDMATGIRVAKYGRVSSHPQAEDSKGSLQGQDAAMVEYCARRGWTIVEGYEDIGSGGSTKRSPGVCRMQEEDTNSDSSAPGGDSGSDCGNSG